MAEIRLGGVYLDFTARTVEFENAMRKSTQRIKRLQRDMRPITGLARRFGMAIVGASAGVVYFGKRTADVIDRQAKLAQSLRTTIGSIAALERAAELSGLAAKQLGAGLRQLENQLARILDGSAPLELEEAFNRLNLSARELSDLPVDQRVAKIMDALERFVPAAEHASVSGQLFGTRVGIAFQRIDAATLRTATNDLRRFGGELTDVQGDAVEAMNDSLSSLTTAFNSVAHQLVADAAPAVLQWSDSLARALEVGSPFRTMLRQIAGDFEDVPKRIVTYTGALLGLTAAFKGASVAALALAGNLGALRAALIRTGFGVAVVGLGELYFRTWKAAEGTDQFREALDALETARRRSTVATKAGVAASRDAAEATLEEARAAIVLAQQKLNMERRDTVQSAEFREAIEDYRKALASQMALSAGDGVSPRLEAALEQRQQRTADALGRISQMLGNDVQAEIWRQERNLRILTNGQKDFPQQRRMSGHGASADAVAAAAMDALGRGGAAGSGGAGPAPASEIDINTALLDRISLIRQVEDAEAQLGSEHQRRVNAVRRERDEVLAAIDAQDGALDYMRGRTEEAYAALEARAAGYLSTLERIEGATDDLGRAVGKFAKSSVMNFRELRDSSAAWKEQLRALGRQISDTLYTAAIEDPVSSAVSRGVGAFAQAAGSYFGGPPKMLPARADGGPVHGAAIVGETGPELAVFGQPATIVPNRRLRGVGRSNAAAVNISLSVNASGGWEEIDRRVEAALVAAAPQIGAAVKADIQTDAGRPSAFRSTIRG